MALPNGVTAAYVYDTASQLTSVTYMSGATTLGTLTYSYDLAGHVSSRGGTLFQSVLPAAVTSATYSLANRLTARTAAGVTALPVWDANGSLTSDGLRTYTWDSRNRLTAISGLATYAYDGLGRRATATLSGTATSFLYDGWDAVQEKQGVTVSADSLTGPGIDERLSRGASTLLADALGSTVGLASGATVATRYGYDPYGVSQVTGTASTNPFQFTGRENDTATGLLNYRNRYYNPAWGRFVSEDPVGLRGGINAYRYVSNNPVQLRDPLGLYPAPDGLEIIRGGVSDGGSGVPQAPDWTTVDKAASADDPQQTKQIDAICSSVGLDRAQRRILHDAITGQGLSYQEILAIAKAIKCGQI